MTLAAAAGIGDTFRDIAVDGPLLVAMGVALVAGVVSFLSPCVLPLVPGYLSYITGLSGADLAGSPEAATAEAADVPRPRRRGRVLLGSVLFVLGFSLVFVSYGALFGNVGGRLRAYEGVVNRVLGGITILLGLSFMGVLPGLSFLKRDARLQRLPAVGVAGAPLLGALFGIGWSPCIGPTLGAVLTLAYNAGTAGRGALLSFVYCLGLGLPFVLVGLGFRRAMGALGVVRRNTQWVMRIGGGFLVVIGVLLVTGLWARIVAQLQGLISSTQTLL